MKFAKLYDTCDHHQILCQIGKDDGKWALIFETWVTDAGKVTTIFGFDSLEETIEAFGQTSQKIAGQIIKDTIGELKTTTEETKH